MERDIQNEIKSMSIDKLNDLSDEIADFLANQTRYEVDTVIKSINAIETTLALHYVFNADKDRIIFDDVAQVMTHKMLTGRKEELRIRSNAILSLSRENPFDAYPGGDVGEGLGVALAYANQTDNHVICVLDDYALNYGITYEVLVQISRLKPNMTIVLIEEQQSLLRHYTSLNSIIKSVRISKTYTGLKKDMKMMLDSNPISRPLYNTLVKMRDAVKETVIEPTIFKQFGLEYHGPIDGQNVGDLIRVFELTKTLKGPNLIHVQTRLVPKSKRNLKFPAFKTDTSLPKEYKTYHEMFDETLAEHADNKTMLLVDTIYFGDYFAKFEQKFSNNYKMTTGSPEALITMASGYALQGYHVILALSANDIIDSLNPLRQQFIQNHVPITILLRDSGISRTSNVLRQGIYDVDTLINDFTIYNPRNSSEAAALLKKELEEKNMSIIRYHNAPEVPSIKNDPIMKNWEILAEFNTQSQGVIITSGTSSNEILSRIQTNAINVGLVHCLNISIIDSDILDLIHDLGLPCYVYYIDSKHNVLYSNIIRYLYENGKTVKIVNYDLDSINVNNSLGPIKRENNLRIDDLLRDVVGR